MKKGKILKLLDDKEFFESLIKEYFEIEEKPEEEIDEELYKKLLKIFKEKFPKEENEPIFGEILKQEIDKKGLSLRKVAEDTGIAPWDLENLFENLYKPSMELLQRIVDYFKDVKDKLLKSLEYSVFAPVKIGVPVRGRIILPPDESSKEDAELVERFKKGDEEAFEKLYHKYEGLIKKKVKNMLGEEYSAYIDDIGQDVWIKIFEKIPAYRERFSFRYWILVITRNTVLDFLKKKKAIKRDEKKYKMIELAPVRDEMIEVLKFCMRYLEDKERIIVEKYYYEGYKINEIAKSLYLSSSTIYTRVKKIIEKLRECVRRIMEGYYG